MNPPTTQTSHVLYELIKAKNSRWEKDSAITMKNFEGYPRLAEYIRILRHNYKLKIKTIPVKFTNRFGFKGEYGSYKLLSKTKLAEEVYEKIISK